MNPIIKNILAVIAGLLVGSIVNMALITISGKVIPPPTDADITTMEGLKASMHLFEPKHFLFPFLAHALGTLVGAFIAAKLAANNHIKIGLLIGVFFLVGGRANIVMLPSPPWFTVVDLVFAYLPMAYIGATLSRK